jgi:hypothetical protein
MFMLKKVAKFTGTALGVAGELLVEGAKATGKFAYEHRHEALGATVGLAKGTYNIASDLYGHTKTEQDFNEKIDILKRQSEEYESLNKKLRRNHSNKEILLDSLGISFSYMKSYVWIEHIPREVQAAYEAAYPNLARQQSLSDIINSRSETELSGFINGIKGKLFEQRYIEYLNDGNLPDGYQAVLAESPTNPGWDIAILDENGQIDQVLQAKATSSLDYVQEALSRYPEVQVVTTEEVYSHLTMHGIAENVIDSGISNEELNMLVESSISSGESWDLNFGPPILPMMIIGYSVYKMQNLNAYEKGEIFGKRYVESYLSYIVGGVAMCVTNFWLVGLVAAIGSKYYLSKGRQKKALYDGLTENIKYNEKILNRMRTNMGY